MSSTRADRGGLRLLLEGLVVLVSILAAFFLEGWRDDREVARELVQELASVQRELERNRDLVVVEIDALSRVISGGEAVLKELEAAGGADAVMVADTLVWLSSLWSPSFDASLGAVDALIASGRLSRIDNPELRLGLAGLKDVFDDALEEEMTARRIGIDHQFPLIRDRIDVTPATRAGMEFHYSSEVGEGVALQERAIDRRMPSYGLVSYPNTAAVRNVIALRMAWYEVGVIEFTRTLTHLEDLIELISHEVR